MPEQPLIGALPPVPDGAPCPAGEGQPTGPAGAPDLPPLSADSARTVAETPSPDLQLPERIGPYRILGRLGAGGMGIVYRAEQEKPRRVVALKVIRPGHTSPERQRRFEYEAEVLGRLHHPGIAQIFEAGTTEAGEDSQPFFAMELIEGQPLTTYAREKNLDTRERLRLFLKICEAVQHAHLKGVIHRDLKPGNILVDATGQPKVLDFGVARAADPELPHSQPGTVIGQLVGTIPYMSPEQVQADPHALDPRSDVYTLGVICYELLAGRLPHDFKGKAQPEIARIIGQDDPTPLRSCDRTYRGDLETIVHKALERDRSRRYQSAAELAADIERYLRDEPIVARPAGTWYQLRKFARRNRMLVGAAAVVFVVLVLGIVGTSLALVDAQAARQQTDEAYSQKEHERAQKENQIRQRLLDSYRATGRLAMDRGAWREALKAYDQALAERGVDTLDIRFQRLKALGALNRNEELRQELERLAERADLGEREGLLLLWQADAAGLHPMKGINPEACIRKALSKPLPPAERAYARALFSRTTWEAVGHLRDAIRLDRLHQRAHGLLDLLLFTLGEKAEAGRRLEAAELLFPEDPAFKFLSAVIEAAEGHKQAAQQTLERARRHLDSKQLEAARVLIDLVHALGEEFADPFGQAPKLSTLELLTLVRKAQKLATPQASRGLLPAFPLWASLRGHMLAMGGAVFWGKDDAALRELNLVLAVHPEGTLHYMRGQLLIGSGRWAEAEAAYQAALDTPAIFPAVRANALYGLIMSQAALGSRNNPRSDPKKRRLAVENIRTRLAMGPLRPEQYGYFSHMATVGEDYDLARYIVTDWERREPKSLDPVRARMRVENRAGAYAAAIQAARELLKRQPKDAEAKKCLKEASDGLRRQVETLGVAPASAPPAKNAPTKPPASRP
jgi:aminoglycoside phosphotransferase (APT) family kinase protein